MSPDLNYDNFVSSSNDKVADWSVSWADYAQEMMAWSACAMGSRHGVLSFRLFSSAQVGGNAASHNVHIAVAQRSWTKLWVNAVIHLVEHLVEFISLIQNEGKRERKRDLLLNNPFLGCVQFPVHLGTVGKCCYIFCIQDLYIDIDLEWFCILQSV